MHNSHPADAQLCIMHYELCIVKALKHYFLCFSSAIGIVSAASLRS